jgi:DNA-binding HxlR family transcriptional regulator
MDFIETADKLEEMEHEGIVKKVFTNDMMKWTLTKKGEELAKLFERELGI